jgi:hypothetical protein
MLLALGEKLNDRCNHFHCFLVGGGQMVASLERYQSSPWNLGSQ